MINKSSERHERIKVVPIGQKINPLIVKKSVKKPIKEKIVNEDGTNNNKKDIFVSQRTVNENSNLNAHNENDTFNYKEAEKKADEFLKEGVGDESDYNEIKQMQKQMKFIKEQLKESLLKFEQLSEQVKELLKNIKC